MSHASATNGSPDMKTHIKNAPCNHPFTHNSFSQQVLLSSYSALGRCAKPRTDNEYLSSLSWVC
jgi:hypothetical protein